MLTIKSICDIIKTQNKKQGELTTLISNISCDVSNLSKKSYKKRLSNLFFALAIIFGTILIFLEPPYVCPDEDTHFMNICRMSHGNIFANVEDGKVGSYISEDEYEFYKQQYGNYNGDTSLKCNLSITSALCANESSDEMVFVEWKTAAINPIAYFMPALAISIMRFLGFSLNAYNALIVAKMVNLLFYSVVIKIAISKTEIFPKTMFMLALMPMSIFQGASTSYDSLVISACFLLFAYSTKILLSDDNYVISVHDIVAICIAAVFVASCKPAYAPLLLILFAIPIKKFGSLKKYFVCIGCVIGTVVLTYVIPQIIISAITSGNQAPLTEAEILQREYFNSHWWEMPKIIFTTVKAAYLSWAESFFGVLGWLDTHFPPAFFYIFMVLLLLCFLSELSDIRGIRLNARLLSLAGVAVMFVGTMTIMFIEFNPINAEGLLTNVINGIQGRYFIPIIPYLGLTFCFPLLSKIRVNEKVQLYSQVSVPYISVVYLILTALLILIRYWC